MNKSVQSSTEIQDMLHSTLKILETANYIATLVYRQYRLTQFRTLREVHISKHSVRSFVCLSFDYGQKTG